MLAVAAVAAFCADAGHLCWAFVPVGDCHRLQATLIDNEAMATQCLLLLFMLILRACLYVSQLKTWVGFTMFHMLFFWFLLIDPFRPFARFCP